MKDVLRLCKETVIPLTAISSKGKSIEEFSNIFSNANLHEDCFCLPGTSKIKYLIEQRSKIIALANIILAYREYIDDELFNFVNEVLNSEYIRKGIDPYPNVEERYRKEYNSNQKEIGKNIYYLYEKIKAITNKYN